MIHVPSGILFLFFLAYRYWGANNAGLGHV